MKIKLQLVALLTLAALAVVFAQGPLTPPPGPPAPAMKTLDQIEPRKEINAINTPGDGTNLFVINQPGSYYLSGNLTGVAGKAGIRIIASHVHLDLAGFVLQGVAGSFNGIVSPDTGTSDVVISNGAVTGWSGNGLDLSFALGCRMENLRVSNNISGGLLAGGFSVITGCQANGNSGIGLSGASGCVVTGCQANANGGNGISINANSALQNCTATNNQAIGIQSGINCALDACTASSNQGGGISAPQSMLRACGARANTGSGIIAGQKSALQNCTATQNLATGISTTEHCVLTNCAANDNTENGFSSDRNVTYENCGASGNGITGFINVSGQSNFRGCHAGNNVALGIQTILLVPNDDGSSLVDCTADHNGNAGILTGDRGTVTACTASSNGGGGILTGHRALVSNCSAHMNTSDGILVGGASSVLSCMATGNGTGSGASAAGDGIRGYGSGSRFEGNLVRDNHRYGIESTISDVVAGNRAGNNGTANFQPATGTNVGPVQSPNAATSSPFANVVF